MEGFMIECERCHRHMRDEEERCPFCARPSTLNRAMHLAGGAVTTVILAACYGTVDGWTTKYPTGPTGDTGTNPTGTTDTGMTTGATGGPTDTGPTDTGPTDTGTTDTGTSDTGPTDTGVSTGTGTSDTGVSTGTGTSDTGVSTGTGTTAPASPILSVIGDPPSPIFVESPSGVAWGHERSGPAGRR